MRRPHIFGCVGASNGSWDAQTALSVGPLAADRVYESVGTLAAVTFWYSWRRWRPLPSSTRGKSLVTAPPRLQAAPVWTLRDPSVALLSCSIPERRIAVSAPTFPAALSCALDSCRSGQPKISPDFPSN